MARSQDLPFEIIYLIGEYLDRRQLATCAFVCKSWNTGTEELLWSRIKASDLRRGGQATVDAFRTKGRWIRSLVYDESQESVQRFALGERRYPRLRFLTIHKALAVDSLDREYIKSCKDIVQKNRGRLESLTLRDLILPDTKPSSGNAHWSPLMSLAHPTHAALRTLRIIGGTLPSRHMPSFWQICERLEVLELTNVDFELSRAMVPTYRSLAKNQYLNSLSGKRDQDRAVRFPKLRELRLVESGPRNSVAQLEGIIRRCPELRTLEWCVRSYSFFPIRRFIHLFTADPNYYWPGDPSHSISLTQCTSKTWPHLTSISVLNHYGYLFTVEEYQLLISSVQGLRNMHMRMTGLIDMTAKTLITRHSHTLREIHWRHVAGTGASTWLLIALSLCPMLTKVECMLMNAQELIVSAPTWVCTTRLKEFRACIIVNDLAELSSRDAQVAGLKGRIDEEDELKALAEQVKTEQCWAVYAQLAKMRALQILDMTSSDASTGVTNWYHNRAMPLSLSSGLCQLSDMTELKYVGFQGHQNMTRLEIDWMIKHWTRLETLEGGKMTTNGSRFMNGANYWDAGLARMLNRHGIKTPGSQYPAHYDAFDWTVPDWEQIIEVARKERDMMGAPDDYGQDGSDLYTLLSEDIFSCEL
ncbi:hypothetical protein BGZ99_007106 [Dissophora globulifera]|uniref:F-box domain-containing protein n=1 Tax=Dissophora globulifera TaxID=979702 RepID=A0A9P6RYK2_9FUNG|nr:hypothetical protein BGZ99_007106 [Dissophora globulifera]